MTDTSDYNPHSDSTSTIGELSSPSTPSLTDEMVLAAVERACDFFNIPEIPVINAEGTCVWTNDITTYDDDVLGFNRAELMSLGISGEDSLTLIYTHECAHITLQGSFNDAWEEELACDFFAGVHAGLHDIDLDNFEAALGTTSGSITHPCGALRAEFIEFGQKVASELQERGIDITYAECIERLNEHIEEKEELIDEYKSLIPEDYNDESSAKSLVDDKAWHEKRAKEDLEWANWHRKQAEKAADRGDYVSAKDHISRANSYDSSAKDHMKSAKTCSH